MSEQGDSHPQATYCMIADDLTGAMDTGLQFAKQHMDTWLALAEGEFEAAVLALTTESRDAGDMQARRLLKEAAQRCRGRRVYKKIDSTLRGNPGLEIATLMREVGCDKAIVTPAFPEQHRIVYEGDLQISGQLLSRTEVGRSLRWGGTSQVCEILARGTSALCGYVELRKVERGPWGLFRALDSVVADLVVVDATERSHLDIISQTILLSEGTWLPCGSAGLAQSLAALTAPQMPGSVALPCSAEPVLIVAGSRQRATATQIKRVESTLGARVLYFSATAKDRIAEEALEHLAAGQNVVISLQASFIQGEERQVAAGLAQAALAICANYKLGGLILTGGDTAIAVCRLLGAQAIQILHEIEPGVPLGILKGGRAEGLPVVTKAGGFGNAEVFVKAIRLLRASERP
jgi:uncharacterized protein YgbK (DUF1537 family)